MRSVGKLKSVNNPLFTKFADLTSFLVNLDGQFSGRGQDECVREYFIRASVSLAGGNLATVRSVHANKIGDHRKQEGGCLTAS